MAGTETLPLVLAPKCFAALLSVSLRQLYAMHARGDLPRPLPVGRGTRCLRWSRAAVLAWLEGTTPAFLRKAERRA